MQLVAASRERLFPQKLPKIKSYTQALHGNLQLVKKQGGKVTNIKHLDA